MATLTLEEMTKFDDVFLGILQHCCKIEPFLDAIFYFLSRRTDFFILMHQKDDKLGFPPGIAERMLLKIFQKHQERVLQNDPKYMASQNKKKETGLDPGHVPDSVPVANNEVEIKTNDVTVEAMQENSTKKKDGSQTQHQPQPTTSTTTATKPKTNKSDTESQIKTPTTGNKANSEKASKTKHNTDCFNGGVTDRYTWSQTVSDVDLKIPVPKSIIKSKELSIEVRMDSLKVCLKNDPPPDSKWTSKVLLEGVLEHKIRCEESVWSLLPDDQEITLNLEKIEPKWWTRVMKGDEEIDKQSIDTTQQVTEFDTQTQSDIRKVMYDQQQKMMGKPTSDEQKTHDMLKKAWDAEGSPFKGTPFDPSRVNLSGNGMSPPEFPPPGT